jgi:hypothetical protein
VASVVTVTVVVTIKATVTGTVRIAVKDTVTVIITLEFIILLSLFTLIEMSCFEKMKFITEEYCTKQTHINAIYNDNYNRSYLKK